jgi:SAM-dependent methyltransferase
VDLTPAHVNWARKHFAKLSNLTFVEGDFYQLNHVVPRQQNIVFCVESICHASDLRGVLGSIRDMLNSEGRLIIFDGFRSDATTPRGDWGEAAMLVEAAMAVPRFPDLETFKTAASEIGFILESQEDLSEAIMPNLIKLSDLAKSFFKIPPLTRLFVRVLPNGLVCNAVAGLLMPLTVSQKIHRYFKLVFRKTQ